MQKLQTLIEEIKLKSDAFFKNPDESIALKQACNLLLNGKGDLQNVIDELETVDNPDAKEYAEQLKAMTDHVPVEPQQGAMASVTEPLEKDEKCIPNLFAKNADGEETEPNQTKLEAGPTKSNMRYVPLGALIPHPAIEDLYKKDQNVLESLKDEMTANGSKNIPAVQAILNHAGKLEVIEGLSRLSAAIETEQEALPVQIVKIGDDYDVLFKAVQMQCQRRSTDDATLLRSIQALELYAEKLAKERQGKRTSGQSCPEVGEGANGVIAKIVGRSATTTKHARKVLKNEELTQEVISGELSINKAYNQTKEPVILATDKGPAEKNVAIEPSEDTLCNNSEAAAEGQPARPEPQDAATPGAQDAATVEEDPKRRGIESIAYALKDFTPEDAWECLKGLLMKRYHIFRGASVRN